MTNSTIANAAITEARSATPTQSIIFLYSASIYCFGAGSSVTTV
jgi:hypothetical protein